MWKGFIAESKSYMDYPKCGRWYFWFRFPRAWFIFYYYLYKNKLKIASGMRISSDEFMRLITIVMHKKMENKMKYKYKHYKGGIYTYICDATLEWCPNDPNSHVIVYEGEDGRKWVRPRNEFFGYAKSGERRFIKIEEEIPHNKSLNLT